MVTIVVLPVNAPNWLLSTSVVVAPPHATEVNEATLCDPAHSAVYDRGLREQIPLLRSYPPAPTPEEYESPRAT